MILLRNLIIIYRLLWNIINLIKADILNDIYDYSELNYFPDVIPIYHVRKDHHTNMEVSRGRFHLMKDFDAKIYIQNKDAYKINIKEFNKIAQCSNPAADLDGNRGSFSMLRMTSITKQTLETACAYLETGCLPYVKCKEYIINSKLNKYNQHLRNDITLLRIKNNSLYYDWPWGNERKEEMHAFISSRVNDHFLIIAMVLSFITDLGDSFLFFGGEQATLNWNSNFPLFSFAPHFGSSDLPFPWLESYRDEFNRNKFSMESNHNYTDEFYQKHHTSWEERIPKAAFYASFDSSGSSRQIIYDQAAFRPDLFDAPVSLTMALVRAWNLASDENDGFPPLINMTAYPYRNYPGFIQPLMKLIGKGEGYNPSKYKYVIVPAGAGIKSTSGRLASLLAHSGAVILLQEAGFSYHFSARLQPWVHYVPLAYNMADATAKIEWLRTHDDLAQQIRQNAINFGKSYLRLEDYYCYVANSLLMLANMQKEGGATEHSSKAELLVSF